MVAIDASNSLLYTSNATDYKLYQWDQQLNAVPVRTLPSAAVSASFTVDSLGFGYMQVTCVGTMLAVDAAEGEVMKFKLGDKADHASQTIASDLTRPVQSVPADFNKDGLTDWVVCSFGHLSGGLYWVQQLPNNQFEKKAIREVPGATQAVVNDYNGDGWPDILVLFAHGDEGIWLFVNDQKGGFTSKNLLHFLPIYGSTSFQLVDFNKDGKLDILYTCGDNSDYSRVLKPYHGMYIFLNEGDYRYKQAYFYPINGCTKAMSADFDNDGDQDIATIAFFADLKHKPSETFLYFEQDKPFRFIPHAIPVNEYGRWMCMDVNDYDGDGDPDVALGNYALGFINQRGFRPQWDIYMPLILLENKLFPLKGHVRRQSK
jgi:hypothetical protein